MFRAILSVLPAGVGVNIHFVKGHEHDLDLIAAAGFKFVRMDFTWAGIERKQGDYDWSGYDELTANLEKRGLRAPHGVTAHTADDSASFWAQRQTVSGWWLGRGLTLNELGFMDVWYYSSHKAPESGPSQDSDLWGRLPNSAPPDWQGD